MSAHKTEEEAQAFVVEEDHAEAREFDSAYSRLAYAQFPDAELSVEMAAAPQYFATSLEALCRAHPGMYSGVVAQALEPAAQEVLKACLLAAGITSLP
jgi:hypothetical protein